MTTILGNVSEFVTDAVGWLGEYADAIAGSPLLLMFVITGFVGMGVGLIRRIVSL